jgi:hypothetical protein
MIAIITVHEEIKGTIYNIIIKNAQSMGELSKYDKKDTVENKFRSIRL